MIIDLIFLLMFSKNGRFFDPKTLWSQLEKGQVDKFFHLGDPPPTFLFFEKTLTMLYSRHDFIFPSLTFEVLCPVELKLQFLYYYQ